MIDRPTGVTSQPPSRRPLATDRSQATTAVLSLRQEQRVAREEQLHLLRRSKTFIAGTVIVGFWLFLAIFGQLIAPQDPLVIDPLNDLAGPSDQHWFGTDSLGRDSFARVMSGGRGMLILAPSAALVATVLGATLGLFGGYFRGLVDEVLGRIIDALLALPVVIFAMLVGHGVPGAWAVLFPALAIASLVVGLSLIVDGLTDVLER